MLAKYIPVHLVLFVLVPTFISIRFKLTSVERNTVPLSFRSLARERTIQVALALYVLVPTTLRLEAYL